MFPDLSNSASGPPSIPSFIREELSPHLVKYEIYGISGHAIIYSLYLWLLNNAKEQDWRIKSRSVTKGMIRSILTVKMLKMNLSTRV